MAWRHVSQHHPCDVCGKTDWCSYTDDETATICRRLEDPQKNPIHQIDRTGGHYWLYLTGKDGAQTRVVPELQEPTYKYQVADSATLHRVYSRLMGLLPALEGGHEQELRKRGYKSGDMVTIGFRSWPRSRLDVNEIGRTLWKEFKATLLTVPGFSTYDKYVTKCESCEGECINAPSCKKTGRIVKRLRIAHEEFSGYAIPIRDLRGRIQGLQLRSDLDNPERRYVHFSSTDHESCGANVVVHVPSRDALAIKDTSVVVLTEGVHKAELAARRLGCLVLGLPSVSAVNLALPILEELGTKRPLLAFDADCGKNPTVAGAFRWCAHTLIEQGYTLGLLAWTLDQGKGLDDVLANLDDKQLVTLKTALVASRAEANAVAVPKLAVDTDEVRDPDGAVESVDAPGTEDANVTPVAGKPQIANDATTRNDESVIQLYMGLHLWKHVAELVRSAGLPDDPLLEARIALIYLPDKSKSDAALAFRKRTISAAAILSKNGAEGQAFLAAMKRALPGQFTAWSNEVQAEEKKQRRADKEAKAKSLGKVVLRRGDHVELASVLRDRLTAEHSYYSNERRARLMSRVVPVATEGHMYRYVPESGTWHQCSTGELSVVVQDLAGSTIGGDSVLKVFSGTVDGTVACAEARCESPKFFDASIPGIALANCFLAVEGNKLVQRGHSPEHRARYAYSFPHSDQTNLPVRFLGLLERAFTGDEDREAKINVVQEFLGAARLGIATRYQTVLLFYGPQANDGKSTIASMMARTMPPGATSNVRPELMGERFQLAPLVGSLLNVVDEVGTKPIDKAEIFKEVVTAKGPMQAERKGRDPFLFLPKAGHLVLGNHFPLADDYSDGFLRRFLVLGFNNQIPPDDVIVGIEQEIIRDECEKIVLWSLDGAARLLAQGHYTIPSSSLTLKEEWRTKADPTLGFVIEALVETSDDKSCSKLEDIYPLYADWARKKGHKQMAENTLGSRLRKWRVRGSEGNSYRLKPRVDVEAMQREARNQAAADEALAAYGQSTQFEVDEDEEKRTDLAAKQAASDYLN